MKLTVLTDNSSGEGFLSEHGLSYFIECDNKKILFDAGQSNVFIKNAEKMGIDLHNEIDLIVLSHGHYDHGNGLEFLSGQTLLSHPEAFISRFRKNNNSFIGLRLSKENFEDKFDLQLSSNVLKLTDNLYYLGEIPRLNDFEAKTTSFKKEDGNDDFVVDDSALVYITNNEFIIISGCAHAGICNIIEYAKAATNINNVKAVIGGFHLKELNDQTLKTIEYFNKNKIEKLYPAHCTQNEALEAIIEKCKGIKLNTGMKINF